MHSKQPDHSLGEGVFYDRKDYARLHHRLGIILIDAVTLYLLCLLLGLSGSIMRPDWVEGFGFWTSVLLLNWMYLAGMKAIGIRSPGYWLMGCKVVDLRGQRLSIWRATFRELMLIFLWGNPIVDLGWCGIDDARQSLRDCYSGTLLLKAKAQPIGTKPLHLTRIFALGNPFFYPRVPSTPSQ